MTTFVAVYRGQTIAEAKLVAVSADPELVAYVVNELLQKNVEIDDPVINEFEGGRKSALKLIKKEVDKSGEEQ